MAPSSINLGALPYSIPSLEPRGLSGRSLILESASALWKRDGVPRNDVIAIIIICLFAVLAVTAWVIVATRQRLMMFGRRRTELADEE